MQAIQKNEMKNIKRLSMQLTKKRFIKADGLS